MAQQPQTSSLLIAPPSPPIRDSEGDNGKECHRRVKNNKKMASPSTTRRRTPPSPLQKPVCSLQKLVLPGAAALLLLLLCSLGELDAFFLAPPAAEVVPRGRGPFRQQQQQQQQQQRRHRFATAPSLVWPSQRQQQQQPLFASSQEQQQQSSSLPDIDSMKVGEMRSELESYGISTKVFLEKPEFKDALKKARAEGKKPIKDKQKEKSGGAGTSKSAPGDGGSASGASGGKSRDERVKELTAKANRMKVGELKKELQSRGVSTKSFFEKSEFVKAYAEAVVDGASAGGKKKGSGGSSSARQDEPFDPSYRDVTVTKMDKRDPRLLAGGKPIIDIQLTK